jgi:hypothetical protein
MPQGLPLAAQHCGLGECCAVAQVDEAGGGGGQGSFLGSAWDAARGAKLEATDNDGETPCDVAQSKKIRTLLEALIKEAEKGGGGGGGGDEEDDGEEDEDGS